MGLLKRLALISILFLLSFATHAHPDQEMRIRALESKVRALENALGAKRSGGLKVKDMSGGQMGSGNQARPPGQGLNQQQRKKMMKDLEEYKKKKSEQQKYLDELMGQ